jgi:hypothetical protein
MNSDRLPSFLPAERFSALLRDYKARGGTLAALAGRSGITDRALRQIRDGAVEVVRFGTADRIVTALDPWLWHRPPPDGLGDLYGSPLVSPSPWPPMVLDSYLDNGRAPQQRPRPDDKEGTLAAA